MRKVVVFIFLLLSLALCGCKDNPIIDEEFNRIPMIPEELIDCPVQELDDGYKLVWNDEFNYTGAPDSSKWTYDLGVGNGGWGNQESQYYTNRSKNVYVSDGNLVITALKENYNTSSYTSTRIVSRQMGDWLYGKIIVRAKLPEGKGTWPAIWMMPTDSIYGGWPRSGEIDIMEAVGSRPNRVLGTLHMEAYYGGNGKGRTIDLLNTSTQYHLYSLEWTPDYIKIYADEVLITTYNNPKFATNNHRYWPFDQRFHLIMNIAMGGTLGKAIDPEFEMAQLFVDYVRVYQKDHTGCDKENPSIVEIKDIFASSNTINISWHKAIDNEGISHYEIVLDNKQIGATNKTYYRLTDLTPDQKYRIRIISVDLAGNYSITSSIQISTTPIQKAPGKLEVEYSDIVYKGEIIPRDYDKKSVLLRNVDNESGYLILKFELLKSNNYQIRINASVAKTNTSIFYYFVDENNQGERLNEILLTPTWGNYELINLIDKIHLDKGIKYLKIEAYSETPGDIIIIDYVEIITNE